MHVMHLGTTMYMLGAVLYLLCFNVLDGTPEDHMHAIWTDINQCYSDHRVVAQCSSLEILSFYDPGQFPTLKGKSAEIKELVAPLAHVRHTHTRESNVESHKWITTMLQHQVIAQNILHDHSEATFCFTRASST